MSKYRNFDANACYGVSASVAEELTRVGFDLLNPNSIHRGGQRARALIEEARGRVSELLGVGSESRVVFTSGATEANNTALRIPYQSRVESELIISAVEHPSIRETAQALTKQNVRVREIPHSSNGQKFLESLCAAINSTTRLISLIWVNNETGEIYPIKESVALARQIHRQILIHSDGVQAVGKFGVNFEESGLDLLTVSGHKIGALSGVGALVVGRRVPYEPLLFGGVQELHHRAGTENVLGIVSFGLAAEETRKNIAVRMKTMAGCRDELVRSLREAISDLVINSPLDASVGNTLNLRIPGIRSDDLVVALDQAGFLISSGAACASGKPEPSPVLRALGLTEQESRESIRISLRGDCTADDVREIARSLIEAVSWMRQSALNVVGTRR